VKRLYVILAAVAVAVVLVYSSIFIVNEREQAIVLRFGEIDRVFQEPGIYFKIPTNLVETVQIIEDRILAFEIEDLRVQVRDGRRYLVDSFVAFRIVDPRHFRANVSGSLLLAQENLRTRLDAALRRVYGQRVFEAALSEERAQMMREVRDQLRPLAAELGIDIVDVRIRRTDLLPEVSQQTFERMQAERLAEAAELRARGTEQALRIRAEADREAVVTVAEANRDAQIMRGEGDAERNRIFAEAFGQDQEFFEFYRSMAAYETAINGRTSTLVLRPDSEFFRYFRDAQGIPVAAGDPVPALPGTGPQDPAAEPQATAPAAPAAQPQALAPAAPAAEPEGTAAEAVGTSEAAGAAESGGAAALARDGLATPADEAVSAVQ
jgi:modulator of FtsH protease HflC